jgi:TonB family protein
MFLSVLLLLAQAGGVAEPGPVEGRRVAILIGNNAYAQSPLAASVPEAHEMQKTFDALGFETVLYANAGLAELKYGIGDVAQSLTGKDIVVVYFSGYVAQVDGDNLLLPIDFSGVPNRSPVAAVQAKSASYPVSLLMENLKAARTCVLILDPGGDQPFPVGGEIPSGLAGVKARKNCAVLFAVSPGKKPRFSQEKVRYGPALRDVLREPNINLDTIAAQVRARIEEAWSALGARAVADTVLHLPGKRSVEAASLRELTWDNIRDQIAWLRDLLPLRRSMRDQNRSLAIAALDKALGPARQEAARSATKDEFETTAQFIARSGGARETAAALEAQYKIERDRIEAIFRDPTGDPNPRALEALRSQRFRGPCVADWMNYDADNEVLTLYVGGSDRAFNMPVADARDFKPRSARLTCEGGFTPESVTVSDPAGKVRLYENPLPPALKMNTAGVKPPGLKFRVEPEYSEVARKAKFQGAVLLRLTVDTNGLPRGIRVVRPLGMGLDEKAVEAVRKWRFMPGTKDGVPVPVESTIEVNFRLL